MYIIAGVLFLYLLYRNFALSKDVDNLYSSRDSLWREFNNEVQARKRQVALLRGRIHGLREAVKRHDQDGKRHGTG